MLKMKRNTTSQGSQSPKRSDPAGKGERRLMQTLEGKCQEESGQALGIKGLSSKRDMSKGCPHGPALQKLSAG